MLTITPDQARQFILLKQGLLGEHRFAGKNGAYQYVRQAGCIQYDPVDVCGRNAELTLQSRVKGFTRQMLNDLLYKDRLLVDYSDKELSIWPSEDWPYFASYRRRSMEHGKSFARIPELEEEALRHIRVNGPVSSDTLPVGGTVFWHSSRPRSPRVSLRIFYHASVANERRTKNRAEETRKNAFPCRNR